MLNIFVTYSDVGYGSHCGVKIITNEIVKAVIPNKRIITTAIITALATGIFTKSLEQVMKVD